ncbi:MAG: hypothetical protein KIT83_07175 [Bryobacterales bacterium]|nr:hypothetical protein [Bryobacterales bacterium]
MRCFNLPSVHVAAVSLMLLALLLFGSPATAQQVNITGKWDFQVTTDAGSGEPRFDLKQEAGKLTGKYSGQLGEADVKGTVEGDQVTIEFTVSMGGGATIVYKGTIGSANTMKGSVDFAGQASGTWAATKKE